MAFVSGVSTQARKAVAGQAASKVSLLASKQAVGNTRVLASTSLHHAPRTLVDRERSVVGGFRAPYHAGGKPKRIMMWFHTDLRLEDNEALMKAIEGSRGPGGAFLPVVIVTEKTSNAAMAALAELLYEVRRLGSDLLIRRGSVQKIIPELCRKHRIESVYYNRSSGREQADVERNLHNVLKTTSTAMEGFWSNSLLDPTTLTKHSILHYSVEAASQKNTSKMFKKPTSMPQIVRDDECSEMLNPKFGGGSTAAQRILAKVTKSTDGQQSIVLSLKEHLDCGSISPKMIIFVGKQKGISMKGRISQEVVWRSYMCATVQRVTEHAKQLA
eukprot:Plantae.Rhodophyta-Purpureofilum_apyrenoidigerum.ctg17709.p1 GENE.Plantae.Rhodophyta-Purpureofilum_apyrenoidigerum.ctg17709~~Plantae.Rhodophyta-Purpureofilum_apyrenoidigerum.ctg17709.p1  ORF type:complete len:329 (+),score=56.94 Plantae.Rhodophyta-Purpureofilum_apyrenoidigerum.ctg17709:193-1179(+)